MLASAFAASDAQVVTFDPLQDRDASNTVYIGVKAGLQLRGNPGLPPVDRLAMIASARRNLPLWSGHAMLMMPNEKESDGRWPRRISASEPGIGWERFRRSSA